MSGLGFFEDEDVFSGSWVQLNGIKYQPGSLLVTSLVQEDIPLFTKVEGIVKICQKRYIGSHDVVPEIFDLKPSIPSPSLICFFVSLLVFLTLFTKFTTSLLLSHKWNTNVDKCNYESSFSTHIRSLSQYKGTMVLS